MEEEEEMVHCPFVFAHVIAKSRLATHLIKCSQQHSADKYSVCPFNSTHRVPRPELEYHCKTCPDRKNLEAHLYVIGDEPKPEDEASFKLQLPSSSENWDEEGITSGSYLDVKNSRVENEAVLRLPVGLSKSVRKQFFKDEVQRFGKASEESQGVSNLPSKNQLVENENEKSVSSFAAGQSCLGGDAPVKMRSKGRGKGLFDVGKK